MLKEDIEELKEVMEKFLSDIKVDPVLFGMCSKFAPTLLPIARGILETEKALASNATLQEALDLVRRERAEHANEVLKLVKLFSAFQPFGPEGERGIEVVQKGVDAFLSVEKGKFAEEVLQLITTIEKFLDEGEEILRGAPPPASGDIREQARIIVEKTLSTTLGDPDEAAKMVARIMSSDAPQVTPDKPAEDTSDTPTPDNLLQFPDSSKPS